MLNRFASLSAHLFKSRHTFGNERLLFCLVVLFVSTSFSFASFGWAATPESNPSPKITIFLADPQLGVVGAYQSNGQTLYFEARSPEGSSLMSARLLDAAGRTIAISGHSMDEIWRENTSFDPAAANRSLSIAAGMPAALAGSVNNTVFGREIDAISRLAASAAKGPTATSAIHRRFRHG